MMKYEAKLMPDGAVEVLQTDGGEEVLGRLVFRHAEMFYDFCDFMEQGQRRIEPFIDHVHPGGKHRKTFDIPSPHRVMELHSDKLDKARAKIKRLQEVVKSYSFTTFIPTITADALAQLQDGDLE